MRHAIVPSSGCKASEEGNKKGKPESVSNQRLTALAGVILLLFILVILVSAADLHALMSVHIVVGILLVGPLLVKLGSTSYRFLRYYTNSSAYVSSGPPRLPLRLLAPVLLVTTLVVVGSGIGMVIVGPAHSSLFRTVHSVSVVIWLSLLAVHVGAYLWRALRWVADDWKQHPATYVSGRWLRLGVMFGAVLAGVVGVLFLYAHVIPWVALYQMRQDISGVLIIGVVLAFVVLIVVRPYRWR